MSPEEKELLKKSVALGEENYKILRSMRRSMHISSIMTLIYWVIIIGSAAAAYHYIQPYADQIVKTYGSVMGALKNFPR